MTRKESYVYYIVGFSICFLMGFLFYRSLLVGLILCPLIVYFRKKVEGQVVKHKKKKLEKDFSDYLKQLDSNIRLGYSIEKSIIEADRESDFLKDDGWVIDQLNMNVPVITILKALSESKEIESMKFFVDIFETAIKTGSNIHDMIKNTNYQIEMKNKMEEEISRMLTRHKYESGILILLVPGMLVYLNLLSPSFSGIMYHSLRGRLLMTFCLLVYILAVYICYELSKIDI